MERARVRHDTICRNLSGRHQKRRDAFGGERPVFTKDKNKRQKWAETKAEGW